FVLFNDADDVFFFDGTSTITVQRYQAGVPSLDHVDDVVSGLGSGTTPGSVLGAWRRGTDYAWIWKNDGAAPIAVRYTNPFNANNPMNPEGLSIADGCVFIVFQAAVNNTMVRHVHRVDTGTGISSSLSGSAAVTGVRRVASSGCQAAWAYDDGSGTLQLQF